MDSLHLVEFVSIQLNDQICLPVMLKRPEDVTDALLVSSRNAGCFHGNYRRSIRLREPKRESRSDLDKWTLNMAQSIHQCYVLQWNFAHHWQTVENERKSTVWFWYYFFRIPTSWRVWMFLLATSSPNLLYWTLASESVGCAGRTAETVLSIHTDVCREYSLVIVQAVVEGWDEPAVWRWGSDTVGWRSPLPGWHRAHQGERFSQRDIRDKLLSPS